MKTIATFDECPDCKVDKRLMNGIVQEEIAKGNMSKEALGCTVMQVYSNIDPMKIPIAGGRVPGARITKDICTKCGGEYTTRIETGHVTIPTRQGQPPTFS